ncbi:MAG: hypothetical protein AAGB02_05070 [Pseudomonadota bacterium]
MRANCEPVPGSEKDGTKENPSRQGEGSDDHTKAIDWNSISIDMAVLKIRQLRARVYYLIGISNLISDGAWSRVKVAELKSFIVCELEALWPLYDAASSPQVREDFDDLFGVSFREFEMHLRFVVEDIGEPIERFQIGGAS